jgi:hypothetical protein
MFQTSVTQFQAFANYVEAHLELYHICVKCENLGCNSVISTEELISAQSVHPMEQITGPVYSSEWKFMAC